MKLYNEFLLNEKHVNTYNDDKKTKFFKAIEYLKNNNLKALIITSKYDNTNNNTLNYDYYSNSINSTLGGFLQ